MIKRTLKIIFKIVTLVLVALLIIVATYLLSALILSIIKTNPPIHSCHEKSSVYISSNGVHLDIIIPSEYLDPDLKSQLSLENDTKFVAFGWGDKEFYIETPQWADLKFSTALNALFINSESAMHVTSLQFYSTSWKTLNLCNKQLFELNNYIKNSFATTEVGTIIKIDVDGYNIHDSFYEAKNSFTFYRTCNIWVNNALKEIEIPTSVWSPFNFGVLRHITE